MSRGYLWDDSHHCSPACSVCSCGLTRERAFDSGWVLDEHLHPVAVGTVGAVEAGSVEVVAPATD